MVEKMSYFSLSLQHTYSLRLNFVTLILKKEAASLSETLMALYNPETRLLASQMFQAE
jgi:hypothetical protein